jgi:hypothetical protein
MVAGLLSENRKIPAHDLDRLGRGKGVLRRLHPDFRAIGSSRPGGPHLGR